MDNQARNGIGAVVDDEWHNRRLQRCWGEKAMLKKGEKKVGVGGRGKAKAPQGSKPSIKYVVTVGR